MQKKAIALMLLTILITATTASAEVSSWDKIMVTVQGPKKAPIAQFPFKDGSIRLGKDGVMDLRLIPKKKDPTQTLGYVTVGCDNDGYAFGPWDTPEEALAPLKRDSKKDGAAAGNYREFDCSGKVYSLKLEPVK